MNLEYLEGVKSSLENFASASACDEREIEVCMEALATQIAHLMEANVNDVDNLQDAIKKLQIDRGVKNTLCEILSELQNILDVADYDAGDADDKEDTIFDLISDFEGILSKELNKIHVL